MNCKWCGDETIDNKPFCCDKCKNEYQTHQDDQDYEEERILDTW